MNLGAPDVDVKNAIAKFLNYLQNERNASPNTITNYSSDLEQFLKYISPPEDAPAEARLWRRNIYFRVISTTA